MKIKEARYQKIFAEDDLCHSAYGDVDSHQNRAKLIGCGSRLERSPSLHPHSTGAHGSRNPQPIGIRQLLHMPINRMQCDIMVITGACGRAKVLVRGPACPKSRPETRGRTPMKLHGGRIETNRPPSKSDSDPAECYCYTRRRDDIHPNELCTIRRQLKA